MARWNVTYRDVEGRRIPGTWRHVFINNGGHHFLADLKVYADGMIDCWELVDLDGFRRKLASGWVATSLPEGGRASGHLVGAWTFAPPTSSISADELYGEVVDEIDRLTGRPTSSDRCRAALDRYLATRTEADREQLAATYLAVPAALRRFLLHDQDDQDHSLQVVATRPGERRVGGADNNRDWTVSADDHDRAIGYVEEILRRQVVQPPTLADDEPAADPSPPAAALVLDFRHFPQGWPSNPGQLVLRNEYPARVTVDGTAYRTVAHAYRALAVVDDADRRRIAEEANHHRLRRLAAGAERWPDWPARRLGVMHRLLGAKFDQHRALAAELVATDPRSIVYQDGNRFWGADDGGHNWMGRLLEVVRSEINN